MQSNSKMMIDPAYQRQLDFAADQYAKDMRVYIESEEPYISSTPQGYPIAFNSDFRKRFSVEPHGILVPGDVDTIHACPDTIDRRSRYDSSQRTNNSIVDSLLDGEEPNYCFDEVKFQTPKEDMANKPTIAYERQLAKRLTANGARIILVNPAPQTLWSMEEYDYRIEVNPEWREEYVKILESTNHDKRATFEPFPIGQKVVRYYGTNGVPDKVVGQWAAYWPNPFLEDSPFPDYAYYFRDDEIEMRYMKKNRHVQVTMPLLPKAVRYTPRTVDEAFKMDGAQFYFLESNVAFNEPFFNIANEYADFGVDFVQGPIPNMVAGVAESAAYVFDVEGGGTYLSRRERIAHVAAERGKAPVPIARVGDHPIGFKTEKLMPQELYSHARAVATFPFRFGRVQEAAHTQYVTALSAEPSGRISPIPGLYWKTVWYDKNTREVNSAPGKIFFCRGERELNQYRMYALKFFFGDDREANSRTSSDGRKDQDLSSKVNDILGAVPEIPFIGADSQWDKMLQFKAAFGFSTWSRVSLYYALLQTQGVVLPSKRGFTTVMSMSSPDKVLSYEYPPLDDRYVIPLSSIQNEEWRKWVSGYAVASYKAPLTVPPDRGEEVMRVLRAFGFTPSNDEDHLVSYFWR